MPHLSLNKEALTASARRLSDHLATRHDLRIGHTHALDALAAALGYRNRQEMTAAAKAEAPQTPRADAGAGSITVYTIDVGHRHGTDILTDTTRDAVLGQLADYVDDNWSEIADRLPADHPSSEELPREEAIRIYFELAHDESWEITESTIPAPQPAPRPAPVADAPVQLLLIGHRHGTDTSLHAHLEGARAALAGYVKFWWSEVEDSVTEQLAELAPESARRLGARDGDQPVAFEELDRDEAVAAYFAVMDDEAWEIRQAAIDRTWPEPAGAPARQCGGPAMPATDALAGPWTDADAVAATEQGYVLSTDEGPRQILHDPAPDIGEVRHADDETAQAHVRELAARGDATAIKALRLVQSPGLTAAPNDPVDLYECQDCGHTAPREAMLPARHLYQRMEPGDVFSDVECHRCGAIALPCDPA